MGWVNLNSWGKDPNPDMGDSPLSYNYRGSNTGLPDAWLGGNGDLFNNNPTAGGTSIGNINDTTTYDAGDQGQKTVQKYGSLDENGQYQSGGVNPYAAITGGSRGAGDIWQQGGFSQQFGAIDQAPMDVLKNQYLPMLTQASQKWNEANTDSGHGVFGGFLRDAAPFMGMVGLGTGLGALSGAFGGASGATGLTGALGDSSGAIADSWGSQAGTLAGEGFTGTASANGGALTGFGDAFGSGAQSFPLGSNPSQGLTDITNTTGGNGMADFNLDGTLGTDQIPATSQMPDFTGPQGGQVPATGQLPSFSGPQAANGASSSPWDSILQNMNNPIVKTGIDQLMKYLGSQNASGNYQGQANDMTTQNRTTADPTRFPYQAQALDMFSNPQNFFATNPAYKALSQDVGQQLNANSAKMGQGFTTQDAAARSLMSGGAGMYDSQIKNLLTASGLGFSSQGAASGSADLRAAAAGTGSNGWSAAMPVVSQLLTSQAARDSVSNLGNSVWNTVSSWFS